MALITEQIDQLVPPADNLCKQFGHCDGIPEGIFSKDGFEKIRRQKIKQN